MIRKLVSLLITSGVAMKVLRYALDRSRQHKTIAKRGVARPEVARWEDDGGPYHAR